MLNTLKEINYSEELIAMLLKSKIGFVGSNLLAPIILAFVMKEYVPHKILIVWLILFFMIFLIRLKVSNSGLAALKNHDKTKINLLLKKYLWLIFFNAFLLGSSSFFALYYLDIIYQLFVLVGLFIVITGSLLTLISVYHAVFIFITTILLSFLLWIIILGTTTIHFYIFITLLIYMGMAISSSFKIYNFIHKNIKQSKELQEKNIALHEHADNFKHLVDSALEAIVLSDENKNIVETNRVAVDMFGFKEVDNIIGTNVLEYMYDSDEFTKVEKALSQTIIKPYEINLLKVDKTSFPALVAGRDIIKNKKKYRLITIVDLSELRKKDKQMLQNSRLAQLGEMISMIAHQWRQPLSAISSTSANLHLKFDLNKFDLNTKNGQIAQRQYFIKELKKIDMLINTLTTTIDDFRNFYKPNKSSVTTSLEMVLKKSLSIINPSLANDDIEINYLIYKREKVSMYDSEMMQVILNIFKNSQDNFKEKKITNPKIAIVVDGKSLSICDNGGGINEDIIEKIFDPYFSTKHEKNGTGIGLYMSKIIVEKHHKGELRVLNREDGVCFEIILF